MVGGKKTLSEKKRVEMHNIIGTKSDEGNFVGTKILKSPGLLLRKSLHLVLS